MTAKLPRPGRLEAFSDGVIAVIVTIMVLELKVPQDNGIAGLVAILPTLLVYALSFTFTAIYWVNHHHLVDRAEYVNRSILYANLLFLFSLSLLPFFTSWTIDKGLDSFSVALYAGSLILTGATFFVLRLAIDSRLRDEGRLDPENKAEQHKHIASLILYVIAIPLSFAHPRIALADLALVTLIWIVPTAVLKPAPPNRLPGSAAMDATHPSNLDPRNPHSGNL